MAEKRRVLTKLTDEQFQRFLVLRLEGITAPAAVDWIERELTFTDEHGVEHQGHRYNLHSIKSIFKNNWFKDQLALLREKLAEETREIALASKRSRILVLSDEAAKMRDFLNRFNYKQVTDKDYLLILRELRKTLIQLQGETDKSKVEGQAVVLSPLQQYHEEQQRIAQQEKLLAQADPKVQ